MRDKALGRRPDFLVIGTQKAGTTWLMRKLTAHPGVFMAPHQIHYLDRNYHRGPEWYYAQFAGVRSGQLAGEKTTEYFDIATVGEVAPRIVATCPNCKLILILRNPVDRAWSALIHHVETGLFPLPNDPQSAVFDNRPDCLRKKQHFRFIERGFYALQLRELFKHIDRSKVLILVFEEDIVGNPIAGWEKTCTFLGLPTQTLAGARTPENNIHLSSAACRINRVVRSIPRMRGAVRRLDRAIGLPPWQPQLAPETRRRLEAIFAEPNRELFAMLGTDIASWKEMKSCQ